jgi:hypothetical protein
MKDDNALQTDFVAGYFLGCWGRKNLCILDVGHFTKQVAASLFALI